MRCFLSLAGNLILGAITGVGIAGAVTPLGLGLIPAVIIGLIGGCMAGLAGCLG